MTGLPFGKSGLRDKAVDARDSALDGRACGDRLVPAGDMWRFIEGHTVEFASLQPAEMGDVRDGEVIAGDKAPFGQNAVENAERAACFRRETLNGEELGFRGLALEEAGLAEGRPKARGVKEELLENPGAALTAGRQKFTRLLGQIDPDRDGSVSTNGPSAVSLSTRTDTLAFGFSPTKSVAFCSPLRTLTP
jgi:hypothetical protein